jgi:hypothetical protein
VCVYSVFVLSCVQVEALRWAEPRQRSSTGCVKDQETVKAAKAQQRAVEPQIDNITEMRTYALITKYKL